MSADGAEKEQGKVKLSVGEEGAEPKSAVFFVDSDSQVFGSLPFAHAFRNAGWNVLFFIENAESLPEAAIGLLRKNFTIRTCAFEYLMCFEEVVSATALGVFSNGSRIYAVRQEFGRLDNDKTDRRPALFTGNNGLVYEKFEEGAFWRIGYDFLCLNGPRDLAAIEDFAGGTGGEASPYIVTGLRRFEPGDRPQPRRRQQGERKTFVFAEQVIVPSSQAERTMLVQELSRLARNSPDWDILLKGRVKPEARTFHKVRFPIEGVFNSLHPVPANLKLTYQPLEELLKNADLVGSISSTALLEAAEIGIPCVSFGNFGVRNAYGTHLFVSSGIFVDTREHAKVDDFANLHPNESWAKWVGLSGASKSDLVSAIDRCLFTYNEFPDQLSHRGATPIPILRQPSEDLDADLRCSGEEALLLRANSLILDGRAREAKALLYAILSDRPNLVSARAALAHSYMVLGDYARAQQQIVLCRQHCSSPDAGATGGAVSGGAVIGPSGGWSARGIVRRLRRRVKNVFVNRNLMFRP